MRTAWHAALWTLSVFLIAPETAAGEPEPSHAELRAAFVYHFTKFTSWPRPAFVGPRTPFTVCTVGDEPETVALETVTRSGKVRGRVIERRSVHAPAEIEGCHVLFVCDDVDAAIDRVLETSRGQGILTVSERDRFARPGDVVWFWLERAGQGERRGIRFSVDLQAAKRAGLEISSQVLRLAQPRLGEQ